MFDGQTRGGLLAVLALAAAGNAAGQVPAGSEFRVNTYTTDRADQGRVALDARGNAVAVWQSRGQGAPRVIGRRFDSAGAPVGLEFPLNAFTSLVPVEPHVAAGPHGGFVVAWTGVVDSPPYPASVYVRRFDRNGAALGAEFPASAFAGNQSSPRVSIAPDGGFVVVWAGQAASSTDIFGQRFDAAGARIGAPFQVNTYAMFRQDAPSVGHDSRGGFVVVWRTYKTSYPLPGVAGQRYDASGQPVSAEFDVTLPLRPPTRPESAVRGDGGFVVTWQQVDNYSAFRAMARIYGPQAPVGPAFSVSTSSFGRSYVAVDRKGDFTVVWASYAGGSDADVRARRFAADGSPRGDETRVNTNTAGRQLPSAAASDPQGNLLIVWDTGDFPNISVQAQRFGGLLPAAMTLDTPGNGVLEPGESVDVRPSWRNVNGAPQTFASNAIALTGPAGAAYTITDGAAAYGSVPNGSTQQCTDCLGVSVSNPPTRPATHWDAVLEEKITPDAQGQDKLWALHVGNSFTDVPPAGGFYHFVETLLHHGVTAGCAAGTYCPANPTTREQMAVFVLVAKEGAGYLPPPCTTPVFADVPASSPFCRWIEELARRAVISGCGGGNYCPTQAVTREQMAVFVLRTLDPALDPPACTTPIFADVPASSPFCRWIEELARRGVVNGCGGGHYCPADAVTREQMGVFISVTFGLDLYGP